MISRRAKDHVLRTLIQIYKVGREGSSRRVRAHAIKWWVTHGRDIAAIVDAMDDDALVDLWAALRQGDVEGAQLLVVAWMPWEAWEAYRDGTTRSLRGVAASQVRILRALRNIALVVARLIGAAALRA